jgi:Zn-dependent protease
VDLGHALAHIFSARYAGAPMDDVRLSGGMPRTLYSNNDVSPDVHRIRALGGLVFNLLGFLLSSLTYLAVPHRSVARELAATSAAGHALLLIASLMPVPVVDGGTLMKWTLVAHGRTEPSRTR